MTTRSKGADFEAIARHYLENQGLVMVAQNWRAKTGEIDLIMQDQDSLVFVEVRYRTHAKWGGSIESIDVYKQNKLIKTALLFLQKNPKMATQACRFDVIAVDAQSKSTLDYSSFELQWVKNAFSA